MIRRFLFRTAAMGWSILYNPAHHFNTPLFIIHIAITVVQRSTAGPRDAQPLGRYRGQRR